MDLEVLELIALGKQPARTAPTAAAVTTAVQEEGPSSPPETALTARKPTGAPGRPAGGYSRKVGGGRRKDPRRRRASKEGGKAANKKGHPARTGLKDRKRRAPEHRDPQDLLREYHLQIQRSKQAAVNRAIEAERDARESKQETQGLRKELGDVRKERDALALANAAQTPEVTEELRKELANKRLTAATNAKALVQTVFQTSRRITDSLSDARSDLDCIGDELEALIESVQRLTDILIPGA